MNKVEALETIKSLWNNDSISLDKKIIEISSDFYSAGLDLETTAAYIKATPAELDSFLALGAFNDEIIDKIAKVNPPKTTWTMFSSANDDEAIFVLDAMENQKEEFRKETVHFTLSELIYQKMVAVAGPTVEQKLAELTGDELKYICTKAEAFNALNDKELKFVKSIFAQKKRGKVLSDKQIAWLLNILTELVAKKVFVRNSIDGDQELCNKILNALEK